MWDFFIFLFFLISSFKFSFNYTKFLFQTSFPIFNFHNHIQKRTTTTRSIKTCKNKSNSLREPNPICCTHGNIGVRCVGCLYSVVITTFHFHNFIYTNVKIIVCILIPCLYSIPFSIFIAL